MPGRHVLPGRYLPALAATALFSAGAAAQPGPTGTYAVDAAGSDVHWLIYRAGALSRLGHNHVISVDEMSGRVEVAEEWSESSFEIEIPLTELVVDDPALREAAGEEFSSQPSADDIEGTRQNMLGEDLLEADAHPTLRITGEDPGGTPADGEIRLTIELAGSESTVTAPVSVEFADDALTASGSFELTHAQLGLEPFSALGGALRVAPEIDFSYRIRARRGGADAAR